MRVLQLHTRYREPGGEDAVVAAEADLLAEAGHEVVREWWTNPISRRATVGALARSPYNRRSAAVIRRLTDDVRPDVAHVHNTWFAQSTSVVRALSAAGVPVVVTVHNYRFSCLNGLLLRDGRPCTSCLGHPPVPGVIHRCYRDSAALSAVAATAVLAGRHTGMWTRHVDRVIAPSDTVSQVLTAAGVPQQKVTVKPHFTVDPGPRLAPPSAASDVLFVGRLAPGKGLDVLLEAWRRLSARELRLLIVGDGPLRELAGSAPPGVEFLGRRTASEVRGLMLRSRALVFPSVWAEPFGMVLVEALAAGLPVVGSDVGSVRAILRPLAADQLTRPGDPSALAVALSFLVDDGRVDAAGVAGRARYVAAYTPAVNLPQLLAVYGSALR